MSSLPENIAEMSALLHALTDDVVSTLHTLAADRDRARSIAVMLEQDAAEARRHLAGVLDVIDRCQWSSPWAKDTAALEAAYRFAAAREVPDDRP